MRELHQKVVILLLVLVPLGFTVYSIFFLWGGLANWLDLGLLMGMYLLVGLGVTIGYHRYMAHSSFKTNSFMKVALLILGTMSWQGNPISWAAIHRKHHAYSDRDGDVHSPQLSRNIFLGFFHAQVGWMFSLNRPDNRRWARDLMDDPYVVFVDRFTTVWWVLGLVIPFLIGGWSGLMWGGFVRLFLTHHVTWSVNSVCHLYGSRPFLTNDHSTNHWLVGLLGFGEGGHNTHHASPRSARHGLYWWHFDLSWHVIRLMNRLRLIRDVYTLHPEHLKVALKEKAPAIKVIFSHRLRKARATVSV
ncbi:MAG: fatty acid desaturase [Chloroflexi bacterium]|nr:fatty acid desaturase [Chloroflexota bacterium]